MSTWAALLWCYRIAFVWWCATEHLNVSTPVSHLGEVLVCVPLSFLWSASLSAWYIIMHNLGPVEIQFTLALNWKLDNGLTHSRCWFLLAPGVSKYHLSLWLWEMGIWNVWRVGKNFNEILARIHLIAGEDRLLAGLCWRWRYYWDFQYNKLYIRVIYWSLVSCCS